MHVFPTEHRQIIDSAFMQMLRTSGIINPPAISISKALVSSTQEAVTLWVDGTNGNDVGDGSTLSPFKTIMKAVSEIPISRAYPVNIKVKRGVYAEALRISGFGAASGGLTIEGVDFDTYSGTFTGLKSGTVTSFNTTTRKLTVSGAGWTAGQLKNKGAFLRILSGSLTNNLYPIYDCSDATTLELTENTSTFQTGVTGASFEIVVPAVKIVRGDADASAFQFNVYSGWQSQGSLIFRSLILDGTGASRTMWFGGGVMFDRCNIIGGSSQTFWCFDPGGVAFFRRSYVTGPMVCSATMIGYIGLQYSIFNTTAFHSFQVDYPGTYINVLNPCIFTADNTSAIIDVKAGQTYINFSTAIMKGGNHLFKLEGPSNVVNAQGITVEASAGHVIWAYEDLIWPGGHNVFMLRNFNVTAVTGYFLALQSTHNSANIQNCTITNCTLGSVQMSGQPSGVGPAGSFNAVMSTGSTFTNNGTGGGKDFSVDGTTFLSKASALTAVVTTDSTRFNRLHLTS